MAHLRATLELARKLTEQGVLRGKNIRNFHKI
jgi:hypothetical protein